MKRGLEGKITGENEWHHRLQRCSGTHVTTWTGENGNLPVFGARIKEIGHLLGWQVPKSGPASPFLAFETLAQSETGTRGVWPRGTGI